jgi:hypothetical protein
LVSHVLSRDHMHATSLMITDGLGVGSCYAQLLAYCSPAGTAAIITLLPPCSHLLACMQSPAMHRRSTLRLSPCPAARFLLARLTCMSGGQGVGSPLCCCRCCNAAHCLLLVSIASEYGCSAPPPPLWNLSHVTSIGPFAQACAAHAWQRLRPPLTPRKPSVYELFPDSVPGPSRNSTGCHGLPLQVGARAVCRAVDGGMGQRSRAARGAIRAPRQAR